MVKDPNAKIRKAIAKKERDIRGWALSRSEALKAKDMGLADIFLQKINKAKTEILELQAKMK
jgi:hypothetical protein